MQEIPGSPFGNSYSFHLSRATMCQTLWKVSYAWSHLIFRTILWSRNYYFSLFYQYIGQVSLLSVLTQVISDREGTLNSFWFQITGHSLTAISPTYLFLFSVHMHSLSSHPCWVLDYGPGSEKIGYIIVPALKTKSDGDSQGLMDICKRFVTPHRWLSLIRYFVLPQ